MLIMPFRNKHSIVRFETIRPTTLKKHAKWCSRKMKNTRRRQIVDHRFIDLFMGLINPIFRQPTQRCVMRHEDTLQGLMAGVIPVEWFHMFAKTPLVLIWSGCWKMLQQLDAGLRCNASGILLGPMPHIFFKNCSTPLQKNVPLTTSNSWQIHTVPWEMDTFPSILT